MFRGSWAWRCWLHLGRGHCQLLLPAGMLLQRGFRCCIRLVHLPEQHRRLSLPLVGIYFQLPCDSRDWLFKKSHRFITFIIAADFDQQEPLGNTGSEGGVVQSER